jgi:dTDP-4-dehydrorhamnose reductase
MTVYLILGATGLLGSKLKQSIPKSYGTYFKTLPKNSNNFYYFDGQNYQSFVEILKIVKPHVVINCIGFTDVDQCENLPEKSWQVNSLLPHRLSEICDMHAIRFIQISTDHFLNLNKSKIKEAGSIIPVNQYSLSKYFAEKLILFNSPSALIIRTNFFHFNFKQPRTFLDKLLANDFKDRAFHSFSDVVFTPISTTVLVKFILELVKVNVKGLIHVSGTEEISKFDFHQLAIQILKKPSGTHFPITLEASSLMARRPKLMSLDNYKARELTGLTVPSIYDMLYQEIEVAD